MNNPFCKKCPLHLGVKSVCVSADGPARASLLVLDEGIKADEDAVGKPAAGRAGRLLRPALDNLGVEYRIANVVRCRAPDNRKPTAEEAAACRSYLDEDMQEMANLKVIVLLGDVPKSAMGVKGKITELAGIPIQGKPVLLPIMHPDYVLRNQNYLPTWQAHWDVVKGLLTERDDPVARIGARILDHVEEP